MKLTDFALIFVGIFLPVIVLVYVNTAFVVKAEKQEMYYKNMMNSAVIDAVSQMKQVENEDLGIDYGYSGIVDKKVSINSQIAISTFYNSLANNFNIANNEISLERLKMYIPVIAVLDYDGIYIHSAEEDIDNNITFITKPKVNYTYSYVITKETSLTTSHYQALEINSIESFADIYSNLLSPYIYEITYTMDDYIYLNIYELNSSKRIGNVVVSESFYLTDSKNNGNLVYFKNYEITQSTKSELLQQILEKLQNARQYTIGKIAMKEISYAVNKHNTYAKDAGINYNFVFSVESDAAWFDTMDGIGMIAIVQGISLGNRYLNYSAYSSSDLTVARKYYVSEGVTVTDNDGNITSSYLSHNLYHISENCRAYMEYITSTNEKIVPSFYLSKANAATQGFYPCPICKP